MVAFISSFSETLKVPGGPTHTNGSSSISDVGSFSVNYPKIDFVAKTSLFIFSRLIANCVDPRGCEVKKSWVRRFFTITLPDNAPVALLHLLGRVTDFSQMHRPEALLAIAVLTLSTAQMMEWARWGAAFAIDRMPFSDAKMIASMVGPRDFYARSQ